MTVWIHHETDMPSWLRYKDMAKPPSQVRLVFTIGVIACVVTTTLQQRGNALEYFVGQPTLYRQGDMSTLVHFKLWPPNAHIYYIKCNRSSSFYGTQTLAFHFTNNKTTPSKSHKYISNGIINRTSFSFTISQPRGDREGWFFCKANTVQSLDLGGVAHLSRTTVPLEEVTGTTVTRNASQKIILRWKFFPKIANILSIQCDHLPVSSKSWKHIYELDTRDNTSRTDGTFIRRVTHTLTDGEFLLFLYSVTKEDEGIFECEFTSGKSEKNIKSASYLDSPKGDEYSQCKKGFSHVCISLPFILFIVGSFCGAGVVHVYLVLKKKLTLHYCETKMKKYKKENASEEETEKLRNSKEGIDMVDFADPPDPQQNDKTPRGPSGKSTTSGKSTIKSQHPTSKEQTKAMLDREADAVGTDCEPSEEQDFIVVAHELNVKCLYLGEDNTLNLETLQTYFPMAIGLTKITAEKRSGKDRVWGIRCSHGKLYPPKGGWGDEEYHIVCPETPGRNMPTVNIREEKQKEQDPEKRSSPTTSGSLMESTAVQPAGTPSPNKDEASARFPQNADHPGARPIPDANNSTDTTMPSVEDAAASGSATE